MWLEFLREYDFDIKHIKGKENKVADALNKKVHELHAIAISKFSKRCGYSSFKPKTLQDAIIRTWDMEDVVPKKKPFCKPFIP